MTRMKTRPDLLQLREELRAAGIDVSALGGHDDGAEFVVHTYGEDGATADLPVAARAVLDAHVPPPSPTPPDFGDDAPDDYRSRAADAVTSLRAYLGASSPTGAQTVGALKVLIRLVLFLARRAL